MADETIYTWGIRDGSGIPIQLTAKDFMHEFILNNPSPDPDEILYENLQSRGNLSMNMKDIFPQSKIVEYYFKGSKANNYMDWTSLYFVFNKDNEGNWKLDALVHNQWTI